MRRFFQTFVLAPLSPTNYYVRTDIFRYQDEIFNDEEVERVEEINEKLDNQRTNRYNNNNNKNNNNSESTETGIKNNIGQVVSSFDALNVNVDMNGVSDIERGLENDSETLEKKNTDSSLLNNNKKAKSFRPCFIALSVFRIMLSARTTMNANASDNLCIHHLLLHEL